MKKKMLVLFLSLCMVLGCMCTAAAEPVTASVSYDSANSEITVTGTAYGPTSVTVAKEGLLPENMSDSTRALIFKQIEVRGSYSCVLGMPDNAEGGKYIVYVACAGGEATDSFMVVDSSSAADVIQKLNAASGSEFEKIITDNAAILGIDISNELYIKNSEKIISRLEKMIFEDPDDFYTKYAKTYAICAIESEENPENIEKILSKYGKQLGIDYENDFANDARMDSKIKADLLGLLHKTDYVSLMDKNSNVDFAKIFKESKAVAAVAAADSWVVLKKTVTVDFAEDFADLLNDSTYKKVKDKDRTFEKLAAMDRSSIENIKKNFLAAAKAAYNEEKKNDSSSSGTGSSGSSGSGSVTSPAVTPEMRGDKPTAMFSDVTSEHWGFDAVNTLASEKIISGYGDGTFLPSNNITRAEFTKLIMGIEGKIGKAHKTEGTVRVACVGDSLTQGFIEKDGKYTTAQSYTDFLSRELGENYEVKNFGIAAYGLYSEHLYPYLKTDKYRESLDYKPDVVVIMMGTNDAKTMYWDKISADYAEIYRSFILSYRELSSAPEIVVGIPGPVFDGEYLPDRPDKNMNEMRETERNVCAELGIGTVDFYELMKGESNLFPDGLHFNEEGAKKTAAEFAKSIKVLFEGARESGEVSFSDVSDGDWFAPFIASAAKSGFINGSDGSFRPNDNITREDAALIIYRMLTAIGKKPSGYKSFADRNDISDYAKDAVLALGGAKIVQGSGENMFLPKNNITRAEAAQLLYNVLNK